MMDYITQTRNMLHVKEFGPKGSRPRYIIHHNLHKSDNYILNKSQFLI